MRAILLATTLLTVPCAASAPPASSLVDEPRLQPHVTLAERDRPLGELLPELGARLGLRLRARKEVADDQVTLQLADRPAAEALQLTARHLDMDWTRTADGWDLGQSPEAARRESALRDREWGAVGPWMERLRQLARTPLPQLTARQAEVEGALRTAPTPELEREDAALRDIFRYPQIIPLMLEAYHGLTALQIRALRTYGSVRISSAFGGFNPRLIGQAGAVLRPNQPADQPLYLDVVFRIKDAPREYTRGGSTAPRRMRLEGYFTVASQFGSSMVNSAPRSLIELPLPNLTPRQARKEDPILDHPIDLPAAPKREGAASTVILRDQLTEWSNATLPLSEVAAQIHRDTGLDVVADSFIRARVTPGHGTLRELLRRISADLGYAWWLEGRTLFLRDRAYYNDRPVQVPRRLIRGWSATVQAEPCPSFDDLAALACRVTEGQSRGLNDYWGWYFDDPAVPSPSFSGGFYNLRHDLRFWGSLNARQKRWVLAGNPLPAASMDFRQRLAFLMALTEPSDGYWAGDEIRRIPPRPTLPGPGSLPQWAVFRTRSRELELQVFQTESGDHQTDLREPGSRPIFDPNREKLTPVGEPSRAENLTLVYDVSGDGSGSRFVQFYLLRAGRS